MKISSPFPLLAVLAILPALAAGAAAQETSGVSITVTEEGSGEVIPCRIHLTDPAGKPVKAEGLPFFKDHFSCPGTVKLDLAPGNYEYEIGRGPEYQTAEGTLAVEEGGSVELKVSLPRLVDLSGEGWWPGDLHVHREPERIKLLMRAEDLHVAPVITWWNKRNPWLKEKPPENPLVVFDGNRFARLIGGEDERAGGALLYYNMRKPVDITNASKEFPCPMVFLDQVRAQEGAWVDIEKPFWWDVPIWLASGKVDSVGLANNHMCRSRMYEDEAWGRPRDAKRLPPPRGNGFWTQEIYYHILNAGLRVPPSAGSASGVLPNPIGYNRVYVHVGPELAYEKWWEGLKAGRSFVTNGPLLRCLANGELPGHVFRASGEITVDIDALLTTRDPVKYVQVIRNGEVAWAASVPHESWNPTTERRLAPLTFRESGWFLVRVLADNPDTFRFASTAPWHVEIGGRQRVSRASAQFFLDWVRERMGRVKLDDPGQLREVLKYHKEAEKFWAAKVEGANAP